MATVRRSILAEADLDEILEELHLRNPAVARRLALKFAAKSDALASFPEVGRRRDDLSLGLRSVVVKPYVVFYEIRGNEVQIMRILHGRRNLGPLLREPDAE